ncbi:hypothetical protein MXAN_7197 [Myxococcus xanthus DK 1622]|uniref:Uncharacterized protein n=1 Tax=Myxococcus xanthus (strain DK1622) TaxID=246197 RepID=Q1CWB3_MYXXD|nr:hypothetical protein MXAN_7197 [Myxococcus xanthus DK 1622]
MRQNEPDSEAAAPWLSAESPTDTGGAEFESGDRR